jgi:hypothetical protein
MTWREPIADQAPEAVDEPLDVLERRRALSSSRSKSLSDAFIGEVSIRDPSRLATPPHAETRRARCSPRIIIERSLNATPG